MIVGHSSAKVFLALVALLMIPLCSPALAQDDPAKAEPILRRAIELNPKDDFAMIVLAEIRARGGDITEALKLVQSATAQPTANSATWRKRAFIEEMAGDKAAAVASLNRALDKDPKDLGALYDRARMRLNGNDRDGAIADLRALEQGGFAKSISEAFEFAQMYSRAGNRDDALRVLDALPEKDRSTSEVIALRAEITGGDGSSAEERAAVAEKLGRGPKNASFLTRLGNAYSRVDPLQSQVYYY